MRLHGMAGVGVLLPLLLAGETREGMLVSTDWLAKHLSDERLVLLHVGTAADYASGHIAGAQLITLQDISATGERGIRLELPAVESLVERFEGLGVTDASRVVVYAAGESIQSATRVWFTLDYIGLGDRASLLDGGLGLWRAEGHPVSTEPAAARARGSLAAKPRRQAVADAEWVRVHLSDRAVQVIDARTPEFYTGASAGMMPRAGRIPGARNVPYSTLIDEQRRLKPPDALRTLLGEKPAVVYCHLGQQATLVYFAARSLGMEVRLYDGSFQDWSTRPGLPVELPEGVKR